MAGHKRSAVPCVFGPRAIPGEMESVPNDGAARNDPESVAPRLSSRYDRSAGGRVTTYLRGSMRAASKPGAPTPGLLTPEA